MLAFDSLKIDPYGCNLIEASAGTGKTYAIASLYVRLIVDDDRFRPENILVVTFTDAATKELRNRIRNRLRETRDTICGKSSGDPFLAGLVSSGRPGWPGSDAALARIDSALQSFDCAAISTIHGFCSRALQENAFESGSLFDTELAVSQKQLVGQIVDDFWRLNFFAADAPLLPLANRMCWTPERFAGFLKGKLTNPVLRTAPEFTRDEVETIVNDCRKAYEDVCRLWNSSRYEIELILLSHPGLNRSESRNLYTDGNVRLLLAGMDRFTEQGSPYASSGNDMLLSAAFMEENRYKKVDPPEHNFFLLWDRLTKAVAKMAIAVHADLINFARMSMPGRKGALNVRFFDDLIADLYRALAGPGGTVLAGRLRDRFRAALIDEFQDTDQIQYKIFRTVFKEGTIPLFLIGDPKQAIYSFRGADIYAYLEAKDDVPDERHHTMSFNWRSSENLVKAVNRLFGLNTKRRLVIDGLDYPEVTTPDLSEKKQKRLTVGDRNESPMQLWFFTRNGGEKSSIPDNRSYPAIVNAVTDEIAGLLEDASKGLAAIEGTGVVPGDIAVIVRGHRQAGIVYDSLLKRGIPAVVRSDQSIFKTVEAAELRTILNAVSKPGNESRVRASLATSVMGHDAALIARTFDVVGVSDWEKRLDLFKQYLEKWKVSGFMSMFLSLLDTEGIRPRLLSLPDGERRLTNLLHCGELLHAEESALHPGPDALCKWFAEQVATPSEDDEHQIRLESDENAVKILTIHVSKGLEFPIVFCPFMWGGVFENSETVVAHEGYDIVADFGSDMIGEHKRKALDENLAENVRLLYVALTRAMYRCYVAWGRFRNTDSSALAYLFHAPEEDPAATSCEGLKAVMDKIDDAAMIARINRLTSDGLINLVLDPGGGAGTELYRKTGEASGLSCRTMIAPVASDWRVASFSSLKDSHESPPEFPDYDGSDVFVATDDDGQTAGNSPFSFPKGARHGSFLHSIFEKVDFAGDNDEKLRAIICRAIKTSPDYLNSGETVYRILNSVLNAELLDGFNLSSLSPGSWIQEMSFYFPLKSITPRLLVEVFGKYGVKAPVDLEHMAQRLNFQCVKGMLMGFIDMVFCHDEKYYIIDWKSNHLGNRIENYHPSCLVHEMERNLYPLQYLLYTVAVNRHLEKRIPDYDYETHFGGVFYLFLRGIDNSQPGSGIYFDKPASALIRGLTQCLIDTDGAIYE